MAEQIWKQDLTPYPPKSVLYILPKHKSPGKRFT